MPDSITVSKTLSIRECGYDEYWLQDQIAVDPSILGGIVVKLDSQQIDASIRTKLNRLAQAMKG